MKRFFLRESRRDWEKLRGGASRTGRVWNSPRLTYLAIADNPEGGQAGKGVRAARAEMGAVRGMGAVAEKLGGTRG